MKQFLIHIIPFGRDYKKFNKAKLQASYLDYLKFRLGFKKRYWPAHKNCTIANPQNIYVGINSLIGRPGNYLQGAGGLYIGKYVQLAPNVGLLTSNHDLYDQRVAVKKKIVIGDYCWIGMNSVVLPGVELGVRTIVGAGSVVTKSFPEGFCVVGGTPAKVIKYLDKNKFNPWRDDFEYYGYVPKDEFQKNHPEIYTKLEKNFKN